jgi:hypothetical protein
MREIRSYGSAGARGGNEPLYPEDQIETEDKLRLGEGFLIGSLERLRPLLTAEFRQAALGSRCIPSLSWRHFTDYRKLLGALTPKRHQDSRLRGGFRGEYQGAAVVRSAVE